MKKTKLKIRIWPDPGLRKKCRDVEEVDVRVKEILQDMYFLMKRKDGVGLAATQVGVDISLVVIEAGDKVFKLVNPRIEKKEGSFVFNEGCLSFPGLTLDIKRAYKVWVSALDETGDPLDIEAEGALSVIFQHEIDHINGKVFIDRCPAWRKFFVMSRLRKMRER